MTKNWSIFTIYIPLHWKVSLKLLTLENLIWEKKRKGDLLPMTWTRVLLWKPLKKGLEKSLVFWHGIGKILLNKVYNCVLCEKSNKPFFYWKINRYFFSTSDEICNFYDATGSILDSQHPCSQRVKPFSSRSL